MSETSTTPTLFDLHRRYQEETVTDGDGGTITIGLRSLTHMEKEERGRRLQALSKDARALLDTDEHREAVREMLEVLTPEQIVDMVIIGEQPVAFANADLAPDPDDLRHDDDASRSAGGGADGAAVDPASAPPVITAESVDTVAVDGAATPPPGGATKPAFRERVIAKWQKDRRAALLAMPQPELLTLLVDRNVRNMVRMQALNKFVEEELIIMVVDPKTRQPLMSDVKGAPNFIGHLQQETLTTLRELREAFLTPTTPTNQRAAATSGPFSSPGASPIAPGDSPGATT